MGFGWIKENPHQISNVIWAFSKCFLFNVGEGVSLKLQVSLGTLPPIHQKLWSTICYYQWQVFIEQFFSMEDTLRSLSSTIRLRYRQQKEITIQDRKLSGSGKQCAVFLKRRKLPLSRKKYRQMFQRNTIQDFTPDATLKSRWGVIGVQWTQVTYSESCFSECSV